MGQVINFGKLKEKERNPLIPRIQGKVGPIESPPELAGQWTFTIRLSLIGREGHTDIEPYQFFETERKAMDGLRTACRKACEYFELSLTGKVSGNYWDMKLNENRPWDTN